MSQSLGVVLKSTLCGLPLATNFFCRSENFLSLHWPCWPLTCPWSLSTSCRQHTKQMMPDDMMNMMPPPSSHFCVPMRTGALATPWPLAFDSRLFLAFFAWRLSRLRITHLTVRAIITDISTWSTAYDLPQFFTPNKIFKQNARK